MAKGTLSLWPDAIRPSVKTPATILAAQAKELSLQTDGVLVGELTTANQGKNTVYALDIFVPKLDYRHRVLTAAHAVGLFYPVVVDADVFRTKFVTAAAPIIQAVTGRKVPNQENEAASDGELVELVKRVLTSTEVVGVAISLIARVEEVTEQEKVGANGKPSAPNNSVG